MVANEPTQPVLYSTLHLDHDCKTLDVVCMLFISWHTVRHCSGWLRRVARRQK